MSQAAGRCLLCGARPASGFIDRQGYFLCAAHRLAERCYWCARPIHGSFGSTCSGCVAEAVTPPELPAIAQRVLAWLGGYFPVRHLDAVSVSLRPAAEFGVGHRGRMELRSNGSVHDVQLIFPVGIPRTGVCETLAHEYGHVLLALDPYSLELLDPNGRSDRQEEGFCEVLRWLWIDQHATRDREFRLYSVASNMFDVYREGFKEVVAALPALGSPWNLREWLVAAPVLSPEAFAASVMGAGNSPTPAGPHEIEAPSRPVLDLIDAADRIACAAPDPTAPTWSSPRPVLALNAPPSKPSRVPTERAVERRPVLPLSSRLRT